LQENFREYLRTVPSLFCDEKVRSEFGLANVEPKSVHSLTESTFRLQRRLTVERKLDLLESRDVRKVDGKPVARGAIAGPALLSGAFGTGLSVVTSSEQKCLAFKMHPNLTRFPPHRIVIDFAVLPNAPNDATCLDGKSRGKVFLDPETLHIRRIEMIRPDYEIVPKMRGEWKWSVDYDVVSLGGRPFWLPKTIDSDATSYGLNPLTWTFSAEYRNYHKLEVTSHIVTGVVVEPVEPEETPASEDLKAIPRE